MNLNTILSVVQGVLILGFIINKMAKRKQPNQENKIQCSKEVQDIYKEINQALKNRQNFIQLTVDHIQLDEFVSFYTGLSRFYNFKVDLKSRKIANSETRSEYIEIDFTNYQGPRIVTPILDIDRTIVKKPTLPKPYLIPAITVFNNTEPLAEVIDLQAYRRLKNR
jgi:hypothetical protein